MINLHNLNEAELERAGIFFGTKEDAERFAGIVMDDMQARIGKMLASSLTQTQLDEFDAITDQQEAVAWLEKNSPGFRDAVTQIMADVENELYRFRPEINILSIVANDRRKPAGRNHRETKLIEYDNRVSASDEKNAGRLYQLKLEQSGPERIKVIRLIREVTGLGLKVAKEICDQGGTVHPGLSASEVKPIKKAFNDLGAKVTLIPYTV